MSWQDDKRWADRFMPEIKAVLGMHLLGEPPQEEDALRATDLIVLRMSAVRIGVRMRKKQYATNERYLSEFTIRSERGSGSKTELRKIISGFGDFLFYGFEHQDGDRLGRWSLLDLNVFREELSEKLYKADSGVMPGQCFNNSDGSSAFRVFRFDDFSPSIVAAKGDGLRVGQEAELLAF
jgi:hypothetical protein